jgi:hypothetical protein
VSQLAFVDTETTGLDPDVHEIWEVALIIDGQERTWQLPVDLGRADAVALRIGHFHERRYDIPLTPLGEFAERFAELTRGYHLVGAVPSFDDERLRKLLRANGACPEWHYHLIDVEALAVGFLAARGREVDLPWRSDDLSVACGVAPPLAADRHTALGDARWVKRWYEAIVG